MGAGPQYQATGRFEHIIYNLGVKLRCRGAARMPDFGRRLLLWALIHCSAHKS